MSFDRDNTCNTGSSCVASKERQPPSLSVSMHSLAKAGRVLFALSQFYLRIYEQNLRVILFDHFDIFGCFSAGVYQVDEMIEAGIPACDALGELTALQLYLESKVTCNEYIQRRFQDARCYYGFEEKLLRGSAEYTFDELARVTAIRSFDFRIMHQVLIQIAERQHDVFVFAWFRWFEMLMEVEDDLISTVEDFERGTYNVFCLATKISRLDGPPFVHRFRESLEENLASSFKVVPVQYAAACNSVWRTYRDLVPRPEVPSI